MPYNTQPPRWVGYLLWLLAGVTLIATLAVGVASAEEPTDWTDLISPENVTSHWTAYSAGLGPSVEVIQASGLADGTSICRAVGEHRYVGVWHQGVTWTYFTTLEEE